MVKLSTHDVCNSSSHNCNHMNRYMILSVCVCCTVLVQVPPLLFVCFSEHLVVNTAAGPLEFEVVNEPVKFPEDVDFLDHAIGSDGLGARPIRRWICHITELLNHHGIEGRESVLSRSKDLSIGWAKHADTLKSYQSLWLPPAHWLHIDSCGMACA